MQSCNVSESISRMFRRDCIFKLPLGVDVATIVPVKRQLKQEFGFATAGAIDPYQIPRDAKQETQMVTGDLNAALVEWVVQYRISDPVKFLFDVREPRGTLRDVSESVMREVVGDRTVDEVITIGRQEIETEALTKMQGRRWLPIWSATTSPLSQRRFRPRRRLRRRRKQGPIQFLENNPIQSSLWVRFMCPKTRRNWLRLPIVRFHPGSSCPQQPP